MGSGVVLRPGGVAALRPWLAAAGTLPAGVVVLLNSLAGILALLFLNSFGGFLGLTAVANPFSAVLTGFLGLPGLGLVLLIQNLL